MSWKKIDNLLPILAWLIVVIVLDHGYFFPLRARSDLQFQIVGESAEFVVVIFSFTLSRVALAYLDKSSSVLLPSIGRGLIMGAATAIYFAALQWRAFFLNHAWRLSVSRHDLWMAIFMTCLWTCFSFGLNPRVLRSQRIGDSQMPTTGAGQSEGPSLSVGR